MSEIPHEPEFQQKPERPEVPPMAAEMAARYARVFLSTPDGLAVLKDLRRKCRLKMPVFEVNAQGRFDYLAAAIRDGQRHMMAHIEGALYISRPEHPDVKLEAI